jgi:hypothetical protein
MRGCGDAERRCHPERAQRVEGSALGLETFVPCTPRISHGAHRVNGEYTEGTGSIGREQRARRARPFRVELHALAQRSSPSTTSTMLFCSGGENSPPSPVCSMGRRQSPTSAHPLPLRVKHKARPSERKRPSCSRVFKGVRSLEKGSEAAAFFKGSDPVVVFSPIRSLPRNRCSARVPVVQSERPRSAEASRGRHLLSHSPSLAHTRTALGVPCAGVCTPGTHRSSSGNTNAVFGASYRRRHAFIRTCQMSWSMRLESRAKRIVVGSSS